MRALESALNKVASHLYEGETRTREAIGVLRRDIDVVAQKSAMSEQASASLVDAVVNRIAERLEQAEARTSGAIRDLEGSFADLDTRLKATEAAVLANPAEQRLDLLASELAQRVDQVRLDMVEQIKASAEGRGERMERTLREMSGHVQAAEKRSAQAIEHMGQEVLRMADTLNQKIQGAEHRSAEAIDHVGAEVSRVAHAVEQRIGRADGAQAEALEKLGSEIARITERLAERIANAERRSAHAIDDVGEQMARVTERFNQRQERASSELLDRMRQSEERTARLLDEAREKIDRRLSESQRTLVEQVKSAVPTPAPPPAVRAMPPPLVSQAPYADPSVADPFPASPFHASAFPEPAADPYAADAFSASADDFRREELAPSTDYFADDFPTDPEPPPFTAEDFDNAPGFAHDDSPFQTGAPVARHDQPEPRAEYDAAATRSASTRELIAAARARRLRRVGPWPVRPQEERGLRGPHRLGRVRRRRRPRHHGGRLCAAEPRCDRGLVQHLYAGQARRAGDTPAPGRRARAAPRAAIRRDERAPGRDLDHRSAGVGRNHRRGHPSG
jgi:localization factor PodJL